MNSKPSGKNSTRFFSGVTSFAFMRPFTLRDSMTTTNVSVRLLKPWLPNSAVAGRECQFRNHYMLICLSGFYGRILTFCAKQGITKLKVEIRADRVDAPILKKFYSRAVQLLSNTRTFEIKRWDAETSSVRKGSATLRLEGWSAPITVENCVIKPDQEDSDLVLAADVLANSLNHHFRSRSASDKFNPLNSRDAVLSHPLADLLNVHPPAWDFADAFFSHPDSPKRPWPAP
jgi:hypothetical protein